jgi:hypothetical protein
MPCFRSYRLALVGTKSLGGGIVGAEGNRPLDPAAQSPQQRQQDVGALRCWLSQPGFELAGHVGGIDETEHPQRTGEHVRGALGIRSEVVVQTILREGRDRPFDQLDPAVHPLVLALPDHAQRVDGPRHIRLAWPCISCRGCWGLHGDRLVHRQARRTRHAGEPANRLR